MYTKSFDCIIIFVFKFSLHNSLKEHLNKDPDTSDLNVIA